MIYNMPISRQGCHGYVRHVMLFAAIFTALQAKVREKCGEFWRENLRCVKSVTEGKASILIR